MKAHANAPLVPTAWATIGPFFPQTFFREGDNDLTRMAPDAPQTARGTPMWLTGRVLQEGGGPCVNAVLEAWQADSEGRFRHPRDPEWRLADPGFYGWGRAWTDAAGRFAFRTIIPGGYAEAGRPRAPHINLAIIGSGIMGRLATTVFLPGFVAEHAADPVLSTLPEALRPLLIAVEDGAGPDGARRYHLDLLLRGDAAEETPFFED
ncbi:MULTISPECIES: protocatechuate 3,4-dioxygenase subunit alpha [Roseomonadaceae]|uniref:Protocatechuate 3,4-dioxygenase subunit alpha n=1 Tax=Falsiroseomonas oleicola TaxID=2801474 RepID=A0ABS6HBN2_9PROT|nr:protocatechuate 3,4-dioxygenase subunit alpha [Roseomonas oleicola]MBU8545093.1 protocatechuate 3,4-dioxygenase subunit alpha [Roseomonas oleicola]